MKYLRNMEIKYLRILLLSAGIAAMVLGIYREEARVVLQKAVYICLECIGIG